MTMLEKIKGNRVWRGAVIERGMSPDGRDAWRLTLGTAVAYVYAAAARVQVRHLDAYLAAKAAIPILRAAEMEGERCQICGWYSPSNGNGMCERHGKLMHPDPRRVAKARVTLAHFKKLSGFDLMGEP